MLLTKQTYSFELLNLFRRIDEVLWECRKINEKQAADALRLSEVRQSKVFQEGVVQLTEDSLTYFRKAVDIVYEASRGELEKTLNMALKYVFNDRDYSIRIEIDDKRGKSLNFILVDNSQSPPLEVDIKEGCGAGVRTVVSFVLQFFYLTQIGAAPFLFIDEGYHNVSTQYRSRFFDFIRQLVTKKNGAVIIISHDPDILGVADKTYIVSDGTVTLK